MLSGHFVLESDDLLPCCSNKTDYQWNLIHILRVSLKLTSTILLAIVCVRLLMIMSADLKIDNIP